MCYFALIGKGEFRAAPSALLRVSDGRDWDWNGTSPPPQKKKKKIFFFFSFSLFFIKGGF